MRAVTIDDKAIGQLIRQTRMKRGLKIRELASAIIVTPQQMQKYELGQNRMTAANIVKIADVLGVDVSELLGTREPISPEARAVAVAFDLLPESPLKTAILELVLAAVQSSASGSDRRASTASVDGQSDIETHRADD